MKKSVILSFIVSLLSVHVFAQVVEKPNICTVFLPHALAKNQLTINDIDSISDNNSWGQDTISTQKYWIVYSNNNNVPVYAEPYDFAVTVARLGISEKLRIAEIKNGYAFVYKENAPGSVSYPQISGKAETLGWVNMNNLLLWLHSPVPESKIYRKAFVGKDELLGMLEEQKRMCHYQKTSEQGMDMNMFFVMHQMNGRILLSKTPELTGVVEDELVGWVDCDKVMEWPSRACIEPQWDENILKHLIETHAVMNVYDASKPDTNITSFIFGEKDKKGVYRLPSNVLRFPVIEGDAPTNHYRCAMLNKVCRTFDNTDYIAAKQVFIPKYSSDSIVISRKCIIISSAELNEVIKLQSKLIDIANSTNGAMEDRIAFVEEYSRLGDVFGKAEPLSDVILNLTDTDYVSTEDFNDIVHAYRDKCDKLSRLVRTSYKYSFKAAKTNYYIIELEMLP